MSNTDRLGNHHISFLMPDDIPSDKEIPVSCTASRIETSPSLKQTFFNYIGKGLEQLNRVRSPPKFEDPTLPFRSYLDTISSQMQKLKKNRRTKEKARQIAIENVQTCYNKIPPVYFKEEFDIHSLPNKKKTRAEQQQLGNHLDMVELTLFSQVTANFNQYLGLMTAMDDLDILIDNGIEKVSDARKTITTTRKTFLAKAARIQNLLQKRINLEKIVQAARITKRFGSISQQLRATMSKGTWDSEVFTAISASQKQWQVVKKVQAISRFGSEIDKLQNEGKYYLKQQIQMGVLLLIEPSLKYSKQKWMAQGVPKNAVVPEQDAQNNSINMSVEITVLDQSYFDQNGQHEQNSEQDSKQLEKLCGIIGFCCDLGYLENNVWFLIQGKLAHFNDQFFKDVRDYLAFILERSGNVAVKNNWTLNKLLEYIEIGFYCKIVFAYFEIIKKVFVKLNALIEMAAGNGFLNDLQKGMNEFIITQLKLFLGLKKISANTDYQSFLKYLTTIDYWIDCQQQLVCLNLRSLDQTRQELIDFYVTNVHKEVLTVELKSAMEADKFLPCSIPSDYYQQLQYLFHSENHEQSFNAVDQTFNVSICRDRRSKKAIQLEQSTNNSKIRVMNKVLNVNGKSYMVCESFLLLLEILEEYVQMAACMPTHKLNIQEKINQLLGFYNWYLKELVLNAAILKFSSNIKTVMVKHLCLEMHLVELMQIILPRIPMEKPDPKKKLETALKTHYSDIEKKISTVIVFRLEDEIAILYESRISQKNEVPVPQSKTIVNVIGNAKQTLLEFCEQDKAKQLLSNSIKMVNKGYFNYLLSLGKRGFQELDWFLTESEKTYSQLFGDEITQMKQQLKKRRR